MCNFVRRRRMFSRVATHRTYPYLSLHFHKWNQNLGWITWPNLENHQQQVEVTSTMAKKNKTKVQPTGTSPTSPKDVPDELVVKEPCMKKCCRSIVTPRHCAKRMCEGKKINHWSFFQLSWSCSWFLFVLFFMHTCKDIKAASGPVAKVQALIEIPAKITALAVSLRFASWIGYL